MKKTALMAVIGLVLFPSVTFASSLTTPQVGAIIGLLEAFGVSAQTILVVEAELIPITSSAPVLSTTPVTTPAEGGTVTPINTCTPNPIITATTTEVTTTPQFGFIATYSDGCDTQNQIFALPLSWSWQTIDVVTGRTQDSYSGVMNQGSHSNTQNWYDGKDDYHVQLEMSSQGFPLNGDHTVLTIKVGDASQTVPVE